jgi:hypothetical protein
VTHPRRRAAWALGGCLVLGLSACSMVLGIDEAHVDPTLESMAGAAGAAGDDAGSDAVGGTAGVGGNAGEVEAGVDASATTDAAVPEGGSDARANDAAGEAGPSEVCTQYCDQMQSYCTGNAKQYLDQAQCLKVCGLFPPGVLGTGDGNTAACRLKYASKAHYALGTERDNYCTTAGPGSDGTCGNVCDGFCTLMMPTCTPTKSPPYYYASADECMTACRKLHDNPPYTVSNGTLPDRNDAQCRLFHVTTAVMDPDEHCEHSMGLTLCDGKADGGL